MGELAFVSVVAHPNKRWEDNNGMLLPLESVSSASKNPYITSRVHQVGIKPIWGFAYKFNLWGLTTPL